jgi:hypothetical protein
MLKQLKLIFLASILIHIPVPGFTTEIFQSASHRVSVLELYTSEGCSSCPPADQWFSKFKEDKRLWESLIPVAFHVDYWNYIGWTDRFSTEKYSDRQRQYARTKNVSTVYTPGFLLNGKEWRSFFGLRRLSLDDTDNAGLLTVNINHQDVNASYENHSKPVSSPVLSIAILGFDLTTQVKAGENRGVKLKHDFVVLGFHSLPMTKQGDRYAIITKLPATRISAQRVAIAAWISNADDPTPLQATGGWLSFKE